MASTERSLPTKRFFEGLLLLTFGRTAGYVLSFVRNVILARMLTKADYGLAAVFAMTITLLELSGSMAFGLQIIQSKHGDAPRFQASAHSLQFIGGLFSALCITAMSVPIARLFGVPGAQWAFALLALVPLCQGLCDMDVCRRQRDLEYLPLILVDLVPQLLITAATWPLTFLLKDYRAIVWLMICKAALTSAMTFGLSRRPYRWAWDRTYIRSMLVFGWPLLLTGLITFGSQQADQVLVGAVFSLNMLANYALAFSLVSIPWFIFSQVAGSLILPILSRVQNDPERFCRQYRVCIQASAVVGAICFLPLIVAGEQLVTRLFGDKYHGTGMLLAILGAGFALRFLRFVSAYAAVAKADTINQLYSNLLRGANLPLALGIVAFHGTALQIAGCSIVAELLTVGFSLVRLQRRQCVPIQASFSASVYLMTLISIGMVSALWGGLNSNLWLAMGGSIGILSIALCAAWLLFPEVMRFPIDAFCMRFGFITAQTPQK
jgi:O-antigen/teichoic acid export membrane protein